VTSRLDARSGALVAALADRYRFERELGAGGMATVYLAEDVRHRRRVAIKVVHPELAALLGPERFLKEIELTASLQHAHILPLFDSGAVDGLLFYVMPYVDGESLRNRLERERQLPVDDAVQLAREVADALDYAHRHGVVHRDVKPENILLHDGRALVADFGIALAVQHAGGARLTETGLSLGTPQYMAPEQATGERTIDARADVYALGAVTYEMLAGEAPFTAATAQGVIAKLLTEDPKPLVQQRRSVPPHVDAAVLRALEKLPADRFPSAAAFAAAIGALGSVEPAGTYGAFQPYPAALGLRGRQRSRLAASILTSAGLAVGLALGWALGRASGERAARTSERTPVRFTIQLDSGSLADVSTAISPDGRTIVYGVSHGDGVRLYARRLDELTARPLPGTEDAEHPFFSPDGRYLAFFGRGAVRKVGLDGGSASIVAELPRDVWFGGGSWSDGDTIFYALPNSKALYRVPARGGVPSDVVIADTTHFSMWYPHVFPGGRAILVTLSAGDFANPRLGVLNLRTGHLREFGLGSGPRYVGGHLLYQGRSGELYRRPFDLDRLEPTGSAEQIASGLITWGLGRPFDVSATGALVYRADSAPNLRLALTDSGGRELQGFPANTPWAPRFSPDGRLVAYGAVAPGYESSDLWVTDLTDSTTLRLTTDANNNNDVQWSPDEKQIAYSANAGDAKDVFVRRLDGGPARVLVQRPGFQFPSDWLRDGSALLFIDAPLGGPQAGNRDIWVQPLPGGEPRPYVATPAQETAARASPNGRWVAYTSNETGRFEVYVESYPARGRKTLISTRGGVYPAWRGDGRELYYWQDDQLIAASLEFRGDGEPPTVRGRRTPLFQASLMDNNVALYDVSPDGTRFILAASRERANKLVVALDVLGTGRVPGGSQR